MAGPRILLLDIETAPHRVYAWGLWGQDISTNQIVEPGYTMCFAAKWLGEKSVLFQRVEGQQGSRKFQESQARMIGAAHGLLDKADAIVHYNGAKFDVPTLNKEFLGFNLTPPSPHTDIDLLRVVKKRFRYPSNKLDYVAQALGLGKKVKHMGMDLWRRCMDGDESAWRLMRRYNIQDVRLLEPLYERLLPWIQPHPNFAVFLDNDEPTCPNCGGTSLGRRGTYRTQTQEYLRYRCNNCGKWSRSRTTIRARGDKSVLAGAASC